MARLTTQEKAARYDALIAAIEHTIEKYPKTFSNKIYDAVTVYEGIEEVKNVGIRRGLELAISIIKAESEGE